MWTITAPTISGWYWWTQSNFPDNFMVVYVNVERHEVEFPGDEVPNRLPEHKDFDEWAGFDVPKDSLWWPIALTPPHMPEPPIG